MFLFRKRDRLNKEKEDIEKARKVLNKRKPSANAVRGKINSSDSNENFAKPKVMASWSRLLRHTDVKRRDCWHHSFAMMSCRALHRTYRTHCHCMDPYNLPHWLERISFVPSWYSPAVTVTVLVETYLNATFSRTVKSCQEKLKSVKCPQLLVLTLLFGGSVFIWRDARKLRSFPMELSAAWWDILLIGQQSR